MGGGESDSRARVLRYVRDHAVATRPALAKALAMSPPTVGNAVNALVAQGVLIVDGYQDSEGGRRARRHRVNPDLAHVVGVEVSTAGLRSALVNAAGRVLFASQPIPRPEDSREAMLGAIEEAAARVLDHAQPDRVRGIGVAISGLVSKDGSQSIRFPLSLSWRDVPVPAALGERFGKPVRMANLVHAVTLAELRYGIGVGNVRDFLCLYVGMGIGVGIVAGRQVCRGASGASGELGHVVIAPAGPICQCGNQGCLESVASMISIQRQAQQALEQKVESSLQAARPEGLEAAAVLEAAEAGDRLAVNIVERAGRYIGQAAAALANVFDPASIVLVGPAFRASPRLVQTATSEFRAQVLPARRDTTTIEPSTLDETGPCVGAAALVLDELLVNPEWGIAC